MIDGGLRRLFRGHLPMVDWTSVESGSTGRGIPDSNGCHNGIEFWIEYKATEGWCVPLRPEQVAWISRRIRHGGKVYIAVRRRITELYLFSGADAATLKQKGMKEGNALPLYKGCDGLRGWDWGEVLQVLHSP